MGLFAGLGGAGALAVRDEAVGMDERGAFLALLDTGAELGRLAEGERVLAGKAAVLDRGPKKSEC